MDQSRRTTSACLVVFSGLLAVLGSIGFARFGYSMILPGMKEGLSLTYTQMGFMASGNLIGYMISAIIGGVLAARYGPRAVIASSLLLVGMSMLLTSLVGNFPQALLLRSLAGLGSGGANVPAMMLPAAWISSKSRGLASGVIAAGSGVGLIATGFLVPRLDETFGIEGWRYSWLVLGVMTLIFALFCVTAIRNVPSKEPLAKSVRTIGWKLSKIDTLLWKMGVIYSMFGFSYVIYATFFGAYLVKEVGLTTESSGLMWALVGGLSIASGPLWGHMSDRFGRRCILATVYFVHSLSFFLFASGGGMAALYTSAILFGLTAWSTPSIVAALSADHFGPKAAFSALGLLTLIFGFGQALGPSAAGYLADLTKTFASVFLLSSSVAALGGFLSIKILGKS